MMMSTRVLLSVFPVAVLCIDQGALTIEQDGVETQARVVALSESGSLFKPSGKELILNHGGETRGYLAVEQMDEMAQQNYMNFTFLNKEISYDLDMSKVGCSCNVALFFTSMPARNADGSIAQGSNAPFYCDANKIGGYWCNEHDTIEANKFVLASTPHTCDAGPSEWTTQCDRGGCGSNSFGTDPKSLCPDASCTIDTSKPFQINQRYEASEDGTELAGIRNRIVQGEKELKFEVCPRAEYLQNMTRSFKANMTMVFQLWGSDRDTMTWLDGKTNCTGDCNAAETTATISNIRINTIGQSRSDSEDNVVVV